MLVLLNEDVLKDSCVQPRHTEFFNNFTVTLNEIGLSLAEDGLHIVVSRWRGFCSCRCILERLRSGFCKLLLLLLPLRWVISVRWAVQTCVTFQLSSRSLFFFNSKGSLNHRLFIFNILLSGVQRFVLWRKLFNFYVLALSLKLERLRHQSVYDVQKRQFCSKDKRYDAV